MIFMKKILIYIVVFLTCFDSFSQIKKTPQSYAIIIGINEYQNIPKLSFAKNDALSFFNLLISPSFNLKKENIYLLIDKEANRKNIYEALYKLEDTIKENDILYFYFSGHGDIESKLSINSPILLLPNSPSKNYLRENECLEINGLKDFFIILNTKKAKSYFICDACHAGSNLIGGLEGVKKTNDVLTTTWSNEIRLLSCQSNELSQESNKWGNGRGVFSFYLELALKGLSDNNKDGEITLGEVKRYLESQVANNTNDRQNPSINGDPKGFVCNVNTNSLMSAKNIEKGITNNNDLVSSTRGVPQDEKLKMNDLLFELKRENEFLFVNNEILVKAKKIQNQSVISNLIEAELFDYCRKKFYSLIQSYYDNEIEDNLLPQKNNFFDLGVFIKDCLPLIKNKYFLKELNVYSIFLDIEYNTIGIKSISRTIANNFINKLTEIYKEENNQPFINRKLCELYLSINENNLAEQEANNYILSLPNDPYAYNYLGMINYRLKKYQFAVNNFQKAISIKPIFYNAHYNLGVTYQALNLKQEAQKCFKIAEKIHQPESNTEY